MDYDADGITGGSILWQTLHKLGFTVMPHVPDRKTEGYGFSKIGIDLVKEKYDPALIISVDHGIVAHEQIEYADSLGIKVIVTDHHQKKEVNPEKAFAIFHTDQVSGSGVAFFFAKEIVQSFKNPEIEKRFSGDFLALAAIGIIADLVPLVGIARSVAKHGLRVLSRPGLFSKDNPGLESLLKESGILGKSISMYDVGFIIAPRINAFGRIKSAMDALRLLCTHDIKRAKELATEANITNKERQDLVETAMDEAQKLVDHTEKIIVIYSEEWEEGIIGLIAGKLTQEFNKPSIVMTKSDGHAKASVRSISGIDITAFLRDLDEYFIDLGGHAAAAGFSIYVEKIEKFKKALQKKADKEITQDMLKHKIHIDIETPIELLTYELAEKVELLEPFGIGNKTPVFMTSSTIHDVVFMGSLKQHARILFKSEQAQLGKEFIEAVFFNGAEEVKKFKGKRDFFYMQYVY
jgi:single-stranded-DNA-specific exonuclease